MKKLIFITVIALLFAFQACKDTNENAILTGEIELISPQQVYDAVHSDDSIQLVDVRTQKEFKVSHLKGSQNICVTDRDFDEKVKTLDKNRPVYVYCKKGVRSANAAKKLRKMGFTKVYDMEGGILLWDENNLQAKD